MVSMRQGLQRVKLGATVLDWRSCSDLSRSIDIRRNLDLSATAIMRRLKRYEGENNGWKIVKFYVGVLPLSN
jgi:hypothetical protein